MIAYILQIVYIAWTILGILLTLGTLAYEGSELKYEYRMKDRFQKIGVTIVIILAIFFFIYASVYYFMKGQYDQPFDTIK